MQVTFLGTSSGVPTRARNVSAVALRLPQRAELWLFDCGEGTQHQFLRSELRVSQLRRVFITHMHGDHTFGLPGLLASLGLAGTCSGIDLYGPDPLRDYLEGVMRTSSMRIGYPLRSHRVKEAARSGAVLLDDDDITVRCTALTHRVPAFAYRVDQKPRPGRFDVEQAKALGIPPGPISPSSRPAAASAWKTAGSSMAPPSAARSVPAAASSTAPTLSSARPPWRLPPGLTC